MEAGLDSLLSKDSILISFVTVSGADSTMIKSEAKGMFDDFKTKTNDLTKDLGMVIVYDTEKKTTYFVKYNENCGIPYTKIMKAYKVESVQSNLNTGKYDAAFQRMIDGFAQEAKKMKASLSTCPTRASLSAAIRTPKDTKCTAGWRKGGPNTPLATGTDSSCQFFEVANPELFPLADEALDCCMNGCKGSACHDVCGVGAYEPSGLASGFTESKLKKCAGLYVIYGLGPAMKWMQGYWNEKAICENDCAIDGIGCLESSMEPTIMFDRNLSCYTKGHPNTENIACRTFNSETPIWVSKTDMSENSCFMLWQPASVSLMILNTGVCRDYGIAATTLLRLVGYADDEVFFVINSDMQHAYNLVKLPGDTKYTLVDTNDNYRGVLEAFFVENENLIYCDYDDCTNDNGYYNAHFTYKVKNTEGKVSDVEGAGCPPHYLVKGCENVPEGKDYWKRV